jgi:hypothetical protein
MQGVLTIVCKRIREKFWENLPSRYSTGSGANESHPVIGDAGFAAMLTEIDAFSAQLRAAQGASRALPEQGRVRPQSKLSR